MRKFSWALVIVGALLGGFTLLAVVSAQSAPQEAALAAIAVALAVIPYCFARAVTELAKPAEAPASTRARVPVDIRCNKCDRIYAGNERACPSCGAHRLNSIPVDAGARQSP